VKIDSGGTFQEFNDIIAPHSYFEYIDDKRRHTRQKLRLPPSTDASRVEGMVLSLRDVLARIPRLEALYKRTFGGVALAEVIMLGPQRNSADLWELRIDDKTMFGDRSSMIEIINNWRDRFPMLKKWRVYEATCAWGYSIVGFVNVPVPANDLDAINLPASGEDFRIVRGAGPPVPLTELLSPFAGQSRYLLAPLAGTDIYISEYSLHYLGMFLLSSLVRYRPQTWAHAISRTSTSTNPSDDHALALVQEFLQLHASAIPSLVCDMLLPDS
jgi:hypothetical protein